MQRGGGTATLSLPSLLSKYALGPNTASCRRNTDEVPRPRQLIPGYARTFASARKGSWRVVTLLWLLSRHGWITVQWTAHLSVNVTVNVHRWCALLRLL